MTFSIERRQQDQERLRVFDGIPLGRPESDDAVKRLSPARRHGHADDRDRDAGRQGRAYVQSWAGVCELAMIRKSRRGTVVRI